MKTSKKAIAILLALSLAVGLAPAVGAADVTLPAPEGSVQNNLGDAVEAAQPGDTITISTIGRVQQRSYGSSTGTSDPWVIDKPLTIQGGYIQLGTCGIVLGADVTFKDVTFVVGNPVRNSIIANGHTLTLENVQVATEAAQQLHVFCGAASGLELDKAAPQRHKDIVAAPGSCGQVIIRGSTDIGNIYGGSISTDGKPNEWFGASVITLDSNATGRVQNVYACGALQTPYTGNWFEFEKIDPPVASAALFKASGGVEINLRDGVTASVDGETGGMENAAVTYDGGAVPVMNITLASVGSLAVRSGKLCPHAMGGTNVTLGVAPGAQLDLSRLGDASIADFNGGGRLVLGTAQTLTISGAVTGSTSVCAGGVNYEGGSFAVINGHVYIAAPHSGESSFSLAPTVHQEERFEFDGSTGRWTAYTEAEETVLSRFEAPESLSVEHGSDISVVLTVEYEDNGALALMDLIPFGIKLNGEIMPIDQDSEYIEYITDDRSLIVYFADDGRNNYLVLEAAGGGAVPVGVYRIEITLPAANSSTGTAVVREVTITVVSQRPPEDGAELAGVTETDDGAIVTVLAADELMRDCRWAIVFGGGRVLLGTPMPDSAVEEFSFLFDDLPAAGDRLFFLKADCSPCCEALVVTAELVK